jgi:hypothetical protein
MLRPSIRRWEYEITEIFIDMALVHEKALLEVRIVGCGGVNPRCIPRLLRRNGAILDGGRIRHTRE